MTDAAFEKAPAYYVAEHLLRQLDYEKTIQLWLMTFWNSPMRSPQLAGELASSPVLRFGTVAWRCLVS